MPLPNRTETQAIVYYPMTADRQIAETPGGWPWVVFIHGKNPREIWGDADREALCDTRSEEPFDLFRRWTSTQRALAQVGFVSISPDRAFANVVDWFRETQPWSSVIDGARLGLVGHSHGSYNAVNSARQLEAQALALLGPEHDIAPPGDCLVVGATEDSNGPSEDVYAAAATPKHLLLLDGGGGQYAHFAYYDGLCGIPNVDRVDASIAARQRALTLRALTGFFDGYLTDKEAPPDFGIAEDEDGVQDVCWNLGDGNIGGRCR